MKIAISWPPLLRKTAENRPWRVSSSKRRFRNQTNRTFSGKRVRGSWQTRTRRRLSQSWTCPTQVTVIALSATPVMANRIKKLRVKLCSPNLLIWLGKLKTYNTRPCLATPRLLQEAVFTESTTTNPPKSPQNMMRASAQTPTQFLTLRAAIKTRLLDQILSRAQKIMSSNKPRKTKT